MCKSRLSQEWLLRLYHEYLTSELKAIFFTLTYNNLSLRTLNKRDIQLFAKRIRLTHKIRYYITAELGAKTGRPHYHGIIYNYVSSDINLQLYWQHGFVSQSDLSLLAMRYITNYINKDIQWRIMSRKNGIGYNWLYTPNFLHDLRVFRGTIDPYGRRQDLPRYYRNYITQDLLSDYLNYKYKNKIKNLEGQQKWLLKNPSQNYYNYLRLHKDANQQLTRDKKYYTQRQIGYPI